MQMHAKVWQGFMGKWILKMMKVVCEVALWMYSVMTMIVVYKELSIHLFGVPLILLII